MHCREVFRGIHMKRRVLLFLVCILIAHPGFAEVGIIPYKVLHPSSAFPPEMGDEYAKLLSLGILIKKSVPVTSPRDIALDLKRFSLNSQGVLTKDDLNLIMRRSAVDHCILGTVRKGADGYISESRLYSVREGKITLRGRSEARDLFTLVEKDIDEMCLSFPDRQLRRDAASLDISLVVDLSYSVSREWVSIRRGLLDFVRALSDDWYFDTRVYVIPFSDHYSKTRRMYYANSPTRLEHRIGQLNPRGKSSEKYLADALSIAVQSVSWRRGAVKVLLILINSPVADEHFIERYIVTAKGKGVPVYTVSLGSLNWEATSRVRQLSTIGRGRHFSVTYHQRLFDSKGGDIDIFLESGRVFQSAGYWRKWREGILAYSPGRSRYSRIDPSLDEIEYSDRRYRITPYNLQEHYTALSGERILNQRKVENNIEFLLGRIGSSYITGSKKGRVKRRVGRALISDGTMTIWMDVVGSDDLLLLERKRLSGFYFLLGVSVRKNSNEPYGISLRTESQLLAVSDDYVPDMMRVPLNRLIAKPADYMHNGLFNPPVWFLPVKVERVKRDRGVRDIREGEY